MTEYYIEVDDLDMEQKILKPSRDSFPDKLVIVMVMADWCGHCKNAKPEFKKAIEISNDEFIFCFADVTSEKELSNKTSFFKNFRGFPHITCFKNGVEIEQHIGGRKSTDFLNFLEKLKKSKINME